ncbi:MAG: hypothetical protein UV43_C0003G0019, partial [Parcubacteria group bacterium GW2011_GWF2_42_7]
KGFEDALDIRRGNAYAHIGNRQHHIVTGLNYFIA